MQQACLKIWRSQRETWEPISSSPLFSGLQRAWHRNTGSSEVFVQSRSGTRLCLICWLNKERRRQYRTEMKIGSFCILSAVFWTDKGMADVCPFSLSSSSVMLDRDEQQRDPSSSNPPESRQGAKLESNHTDANTDWFYQFTYCSSVVDKSAQGADGRYQTNSYIGSYGHSLRFVWWLWFNKTRHYWMPLNSQIQQP